MSEVRGQKPVEIGWPKEFSANKPHQVLAALWYCGGSHQWLVTSG